MALTVDNLVTALSRLLAGSLRSVVPLPRGVPVGVVGGFHTDAKVHRPKTRAVRNVGVGAHLEQLVDDAPNPDARGDVEGRVAAVVLRIDNLAHESDNVHLGRRVDAVAVDILAALVAAASLPHHPLQQTLEVVLACHTPALDGARHGNVVKNRPAPVIRHVDGTAQDVQELGKRRVVVRVGDHARAHQCCFPRRIHPEGAGTNVDQSPQQLHAGQGGCPVEGRVALAVDRGIQLLRDHVAQRLERYLVRPVGLHKQPHKHASLRFGLG